jgi:transposase
MQPQELLQIRKQKGIEIAKNSNVKLNGYKWSVPSQSSNKTYEVILRIDKSVCNCPDFIERGLKCKHIFAVEITLTKTIDSKGNTTITQTKHITYSQDWPNYTKAQTEEGRLFKVLLKDLVENIPEEPYVFGRPRYPLKEALFCAIDKVYSMQSSRRAYSRYKDAEGKAQIIKAPNYNLINKTLNKEGITPILSKLLMLTAMPLKAVETNFAVDSTGFRTSQFSDYCEKKHNTKPQHEWIKAHLIIGVKTNVVASARVMEEHSADSPQFIPLVEETVSMGFTMDEISADKAYNSINNYNAVQTAGGTAYIPYRSNTTALANTGNKARLWRKMFHYFQLNQDDFMQHYHLRSNVESTNMAIKAKLGDSVKSKNFTARANEVLCKLIAYNITVLISAMYELKIDPKLT